MTTPLWVRTAALLALTFAAGAMAGVAYDRHIAPMHHGPPADARQLLAHLEDGLKLDSAQRTTIAAILARHQGVVDSAWHALQPHVGAMLDSVHHEILAVLTPEQRARFRSMVQTMHGR
jgi:Spy/CpxP family protein refolding chaperone